MSTYDLLTIFIGLFLSILLIVKYLETKSNQLLNYIPNIWTSLGILMTFWSIVNTLTSIDLGISKLDSSKLIADLIIGISPAFSTSIIGIIGSIISSIAIRVHYSLEEKNESGLIPVDVTPEKSLYDLNENLLKMDKSLYKQLAIIINNQIDAEKNESLLTDKLITTLNQQSSILKSFVDDFVANMNNLFEDLRNALNVEILSFGKDQFDKSTALIENFNKQIHDRNNILMEAQSNNIEKYFESNNKKMSDISTLLMNIVEINNNNVMKKFDDLLNLQGKNMKDWSDNNHAQLTDLNNKFTSAFDGITTRQVESLNQMTDLSSAYQKLTEVMYSKVVQANTDSISALNQQILNYGELIKTEFVSYSEQINSALTNNIEELKGSYNYLKDRLAQLIANYEQATEAYSDAVQNAHDLNTSIEKCVVLVGKNIDKNTTTNEQLGLLISNVEEKYVNIENLIFKIKEIHDVIDVLSQLETHLNKIVKHEKTV